MRPDIPKNQEKARGDAPSATGLLGCRLRFKLVRARSGDPSRRIRPRSARLSRARRSVNEGVGSDSREKFGS